VQNYGGKQRTKRGKGCGKSKGEAFSLRTKGEIEVKWSKTCPDHRMERSGRGDQRIFKKEGTKRGWNVLKG